MFDSGFLSKLLILKDSFAKINVTFKYGGVPVSTGIRSIDCMRRMSVGLLNHLAKNINANKQNKIVDVDFSEGAFAMAA